MTDPTLSRRSLIALGAAAAALPKVAWAQSGATTIRDMIVINALGGISNPNVKSEAGDAGVSRAETLTIDARAIADARASGITAVNLTLGYVAGKDEPYELTVREIASWDARIRSVPNDVVKILSAADILAAKKVGKVGIIYGFQNSAMMGDKADRVVTFADLGVRIMQLTYNIANAAGSGCLVPQDGGLTAFGRDLVAQMDAKRVIVDLSHSGTQTCLDAARAAKRPIAITHTGCRALTDLPRNKTDEELRLVAGRGGFVGIYFMPFLAMGRPAKAADVVDHILHALNICGEDHVGIGTDGNVTSYDDMDAYMVALAKEIATRRAAGISAPGERPDITPFVMDMRGPGQFQILADKLSQRGVKSAQIEKILGTNFVNYARDIWGG